LWRIAIRIDEEQLRRRLIRTAATWTTLPATTARSAINELSMIGADFVSGNASRECRRTTITQAITQ
jgi:hypothetical protein